MSILGLVQCKIQHGVGSGSIVINEVDVDKTVVFISSAVYSTGGSTTAGQGVASATLVDATHINCTHALAWWVVELGGAVSE